MATHSNILARKILWTEEPDGLQSIGSQRVRRDCSNLLVCKFMKSYHLKTTEIVTDFEIDFGLVLLCFYIDFPFSHEDSNCQSVSLSIQLLRHV